ncbi:MAG: glycosyltransferase family 2 protein [Candidatus Omnitrophica bacterium]|nr:glycosyltransferase family 2 protein [Candidatus Omnitrophota bacterium]
MNPNNNPVSIIIPFRNEEKYLERTCENMQYLVKNYSQIDVVYINSRSQDSSESIIKQFNRFKVLSCDKSGPYAARNAGITGTTSDILVFADADCLYSNKWLSEILAAFEGGLVKMCIGSVQCDSSRSFLLRSLDRYNHLNMKRCYQNHGNTYTWAHGGNMAVKRELFEEFGLFKEVDGGEDTCFFHRVSKNLNSGKVHILNDCHCTHLEIPSTAIFLKRAFNRGKKHAERNDKLEYVSFFERLKENLQSISAGELKLKDYVGANITLLLWFTFKKLGLISNAIKRHLERSSEK